MFERIYREPAELPGVFRDIKYCLEILFYNSWCTMTFVLFSELISTKYIICYVTRCTEPGR